MRLLCITEPGDYPQEDGEISLFYRHIANDPDLEVFHTATRDVVPGIEARAVKVPRGLTHQGFLELPRAVPQPLRIADLDFVFCRTKKPFPHGYLETLHGWSQLTGFCNAPLAKVEQIKAGFLQKVASGFIPDMLATADAGEIEAFLHRHKVIVVKRPNSTGGVGVFRLQRVAGQVETDHVTQGSAQHFDLNAAIRHIRAGGAAQEPLELVRFLPRATEGDKRIVVVEGEIYGAYLRRSAAGHWVNNLSSAAADVALADVTSYEADAIAASYPHYQDRGLRILGYDFLCDDDGSWKISEINAGNVGGFARLQMLSGKPVMAKLVDWMRQRAGVHRLVKSHCI